MNVVDLNGIFKFKRKLKDEKKINYTRINVNSKGV